MRLLIGIDPDVKKSGFAIYDKDKKQLTDVVSWPFFDITDFLIHNKHRIESVVIEAGWLLKKSNWHTAKGRFVDQKTAKDVGRNHQVGILLEEYCQRNNINYELQKPSGVAKKMDSELFNRITGWRGRSNEDSRDAAFLVFGRGGAEAEQPF